MKFIYLLMIIVVTSIFSNLMASEEGCVSKDQSVNMCKNFGYCTSYPLGKENTPCAQEWSIPKNWTATAPNCLTNVESSGQYSCKNGGTINVTICGKSNCYQCICN